MNGPTARCLSVPIALLWLCLSRVCLASDDSILLIADDDMASPVFARSVVLVAPTRHGGALGVIINRKIPHSPARLFPDDELLQQVGEVYFGGPVQPDQVVFLFRTEEPPDDAMHLFEDVYVSTNRELLAEQLRRPQEKSGLQVYVGYAGWAPGQLQMELMHGVWSTREVDADLLFDTERDSIWEQLNAETIPVQI
jgi:putative transcriptional regulator